jgi:phenylacetate-CoA ligase
MIFAKSVGNPWRSDQFAHVSTISANRVWAMTDRLEEQLNYVSSTIPYYQKLRVSKTSSLSQFPVVSKSMIRNNYGDFIADEFAGRDELVRTLNNNPTTVRVRMGEILVEHTSGTSGIPFNCPKSFEDRVRLGVGIWQQRRKADPLVSPAKIYRLVHTGTSLPKADPWSREISALQSLYSEIAQTKSRWIHANSTMLLQHAETFAIHGWQPVIPEVKFIECSGEFMDPETRLKLETAFSARIIDQYGMMETWVIALTCAHHIHHVNDHNVHVEVLDEQNNPLPLGVPGKIVVTSLQEKLLPFVRYETADYGMWVEEACSCLLGKKTLALCKGRRSELIKGCSGLVFGNVLFSDAVRNASLIWDLADLKYLRVSQTNSTTFVLRTNRIKQLAEFCEYVQQYVGAQLGRPMRVLHVTALDSEISQDGQRKPWLFRCEVSENYGL